ncbi:LGFP repeat-containing protein [Neobacillus bataviensis]|uniref:LGFP repeat-containing protein n=1 Tax=Neobacillus bataviensis TaxID=220685 RepID=UPI001CBE6188|nr:hypothetical protein [Neobacillus bataviensis]
MFRSYYPFVNDMSRGPTYPFIPSYPLIQLYPIQMTADLYRVSPIDKKYAELDSKGLGQPIGPEEPGPYPNGKFRRYQHGIITWSQETGAHRILGRIAKKWQEMKGSPGYALSDQGFTALGQQAEFQYGNIYSSDLTGTANEVHGLILERYKQLGGTKGVLGLPISDETKTADGKGRFNNFVFGKILWSQETGAWELRGPIWTKYSQLGEEKSILRYPVSGDIATPDGKGSYQQFQYGYIYYKTLALSAFEVHGLILKEYLKLGATTSKLGFPVSDEKDLPGVAGGKISNFENGDIIYDPVKGVSVYYR